MGYYKRYIAKVLLALMLLFGGIMYEAYATDTYYLHDVGFLSGASDMVHRNGRIVTAFVYWLAAKLDLPITSFYYLSYVLAILFYLGAMILLDRMTRQIVENENYRILLCLLLIVNPFIIEYFMFIEMFAFAFAILMEVATVYAFYRYIATGGRLNGALSLIFLLLAFMSYQASTGLFIVLTMPIVYHACKNSDGCVVRKYVGRLILMAMTYLLAAALYMLIFYLGLHGTRGQGRDYGSLLSILHDAIESEQDMLTTTCRILPAYTYLTFAGLAAICCLLSIAWIRNKVLWLFHIVLSIAALMAIAAVPSVVGGNFTARTVYPLGSLIGVLMINTAIAIENGGGERIRTALWLRTVMSMLASALLATYVVCFGYVYISKHQLNYADELRCRMIGQAITEYEQDSEIRITRIAFYKDSAYTGVQYPNIFIWGDLCISSFTKNWSDIQALNYYLNTQYVRAEQDPVYTDYYAGQNWSQFSSEQMIFDGDTLHYCVY